MKERPILMTSPMVQALLEGRKTQTRRVIKKHPSLDRKDFRCVQENWIWRFERPSDEFVSRGFECPYGQPGDRLWVRETWQYYGFDEDGAPKIRYAADNSTRWPNVSEDRDIEKIQDAWIELSDPKNYEIDNTARDRRWRPSTQMPCWASRILLEITDLHVERLQQISESDMKAEGAVEDQRGYGNDCPLIKQGFIGLWCAVQGSEDAWVNNPWVWVITFKKMEHQ